jgi:hypothetical protein
MVDDHDVRVSRRVIAYAGLLFLALAILGGIAIGLLIQKPCCHCNANSNLTPTRSVKAEAIPQPKTDVTSGATIDHAESGSQGISTAAPVSTGAVSPAPTSGTTGTKTVSKVTVPAPAVGKPASQPVTTTPAPVPVKPVTTTPVATVPTPVRTVTPTPVPTVPTPVLTVTPTPVVNTPVPNKPTGTPTTGHKYGSNGNPYHPGSSNSGTPGNSSPPANQGSQNSPSCSTPCCHEGNSQH